MTTANPFVVSESWPEASAWDNGYLTGFNSPEYEGIPPYVANLVAAFVEGRTAGREAKAEPSPVEGHSWVDSVGELLAELALEVGTHWGIEKIAEPFFGVAGGLVALLPTVIGIPGDVQLKEMTDDFSAGFGQDDDDARYIAGCSRTDHGPIEGMQPTGEWLGVARTDIKDALTDMKNHGHTEVLLTRCSLRDKTCGVVWVTDTK